MIYGVVAAALYVVYLAVLWRSVPPAPRLRAAPREEGAAEACRRAG